MKMSAKTLKSKEKPKPKLKTILANPHKTKCPNLSQEQFQHFGELLRAAMERSELEPRKFVAAHHIHLGLQSCLRAINQSACACVFLSLSLKPRYVLSLIARNAEVKDETVPVYVQPNLEEFTAGLFGLRTMALVLPRDMGALGSDLERWVATHRKPKRLKILPEIKHLKLKRKSVVAGKRDVQVEPVALPTKLPTPPQATKTFSSDFISFSANDDVDMDQLNLKDDKNNLRAALNEIIEKSKLSGKQEPVQRSESTATPAVAEIKIADVLDDDFLSETDYQVLTVHKIKPNPNRKRKKRSKKNKNNKKT